MPGKKMGDHERPRLGNDIYQHPHLPQVHPVDPADGIPRPAASFSMEDALAPPLTLDTMVCMEDASAYVFRGEKGTILWRTSPDRVSFWPNGDARISVEDLSGDEYREFVPYLGVQEANGYVPVEALRAQCAFYKRVMLDFEGSDQAKHVERSCAAQRTEGGEYVSLADCRVYACEHRSPRDFVSEQRLRKFDAAQAEAIEKSEAEADLEGQLALMNEQANKENSNA